MVSSTTESKTLYGFTDRNREKRHTEVNRIRKGSRFLRGGLVDIEISEEKELTDRLLVIRGPSAHLEKWGNVSVTMGEEDLYSLTKVIMGGKNF